MSLQAAIDFATHGWPVLPCHPQTKRPLLAKEVGEDGVRLAKSGGLKRATADLDQVRAWWDRWPRAMIGVPTGSAIGAFVVDLDVKPQGPTVEELLGELERVCGKLPATRTAITRSGGRHLYFRMPAGVALGNRAGVLAGIDIRGEGGYVIVPPSRTSAGEAYRWAEGAEDLPIAEAPAALVRLVTERRERDGEASAPAVLRPALARPDAQAEAIDKYTGAALATQTRKVREAPKGTRNSALNAAALSLGHLVGAGALSEMLVRASLEDAARASGLARDDGIDAVRATIESGLSAGKAEPADLSNVGTLARGRPLGARPAPSALDGKPPSQMRGGADREPPGGRGGQAEADDRRLALLPLTDLGNAQRFVERFGDRFRYCPELGWLAWDGRRWNRHAADGLLSRAVHDTVIVIADEASALKGSPEDASWKDRSGGRVYLSDMVRAWAKTSQAAAHIGCIPRLAQPYVEVQTGQLDADPMKLNVLNGTLEVARRQAEPYVRFRPHDPADLITKLAPVNYDPEARCLAYDAFLAEMQPDAGMRAFLHRQGGLSLTGDATQQKLFFWYGKGRNGKSTLADAWADVIGDYAETLPVETFLDQGRQRRGGDATPDLAVLHRIRFLRTSEPERGAKLGEALIKIATGGEPLKVRHLNRDFFTLRPEFKLLMSGNYKPRIDGTDDGIWRRVVLIPWDVQITEEQVDAGLPVRLKAEASGILNRLLDGLCDFLDGGLRVPGEVVEATQTYRTESDPLGRFLEACVRPAVGERVQSSELHRLFCAWARASGEKEWSAKGFGLAMRERGFRSKLSNVIYWLDITTVHTIGDFIDLDGNPRVQRHEKNDDPRKSP